MGERIAKNLDETGNKDKLRNKSRIEISVAIVLSKKSLLKKHADIILNSQTPEGFWLEYSYEKEEPAVGYYGAIPTSFCIIALVEAFKELKHEKYLYSAIKAADYLSDKEKNGYFYKAGNNKSDVINTNLMAGMALLELSKVMPVKSRRNHIYKAACVKAIKRALHSQFWNGAYPYTSYGLTVPFLYHAMTLAQLTYLASEFNDSLLDFSIIKGKKYLKKITAKNGKIKWDKEKFSDKSGAIWAYSWSKVAYENLQMFPEMKLAEKHLNRLKGKKFYFEGDFNKDEDPFYTSWCLIANHFVKKVKPKASFIGIIRFLFRVNIFKKINLYFKIIRRKFFSFGLDSGPVEYV